MASAGERPPVDARLAGDPPSRWEQRFAYSRIVRAGPYVTLSGTTSATEDGAVLGLSAYEQAVEIMRRLAHELSRVGATLADVVQTRIYLIDIARAEEVGRAHSEAFGDTRPVTTMVQVAALIDPRMLVEIEAVAWCPG